MHTIIVWYLVMFTRSNVHYQVQCTTGISCPVRPQPVDVGYLDPLFVSRGNVTLNLLSTEHSRVTNIMASSDRWCNVPLAVMQPTHICGHSYVLAMCSFLHSGIRTAFSGEKCLQQALLVPLPPPCYRGCCDAGANNIRSCAPTRSS